MRVLLYCPNYLPAIRYGGPVRSSHGLAKALVSQGHDVHVITTNVDGPDLIDAPLAVPVDIEGVSVRYFATQAPRRIYLSSMMGRVLEAEAGAFDVVHTNGMFLWPGPKAAAAAVRSGTPVVVSPRGMLAPELIAGRSTLVKKLWISLYERRHLANAAAIHVTSDEEADGVRRAGLDLTPILVIANGVEVPSALPNKTDVEEIWKGVPPGSRVALLSRLDWTKGIDLAIEACALTSRSQLLIAGPDQIGLRTKLEPIIPQGVDGKPIARFVGAVDGARKWALLAGADLILAPSVKESFGMSVAEALAMGTPVVCTEGVGAKTIVNRLDPALVVKRDVRALADAIETMLSQPERCAAVGRQGASLMRREYSWHAIATQMANLYVAAGTNRLSNLTSTLPLSAI